MRGQKRCAADCPDRSGQRTFLYLIAWLFPKQAFVRPRLPSEIKSDLTLGWAHTRESDPACYECLPVPHETLCVLNCPVKIGLSGAVSGALSAQH